MTNAELIISSQNSLDDGSQYSLQVTTKLLVSGWQN